MSSKKTQFAAFVVIAVAVAIIYIPYMNMFIGHDSIYWLLWSQSPSPVGIGSFFLRGSQHNYRPLTTSLFFYVGQGLWGFRPWVFRLSNILVLMANAVMVFLVYKKIGANKLLAFFAAFIYGTHFTHGLVVHLSHIQGLGSTFFFLLSFLFFISDEGPHRKLFQLLSLLAFICALLSREEAVVIPLVFLLYELIFKGEAGFAKRLSQAFRRLIAYFSILGFYLIWRFLILGISLPKAGGYKPIFDIMAIVGKYISYVWWTLYGPQLPLLIIICLLIVWAAVNSLRRRKIVVGDIPIKKLLLFSALFYFVYLWPVCPIKYTAKHFLSTPMVGAAGILGTVFYCAVGGYVRRTRFLMVVSLVTIIFIFSLREVRSDAACSSTDLGEIKRDAMYNEKLIKKIKAHAPSMPRGSRVHLVGVSPRLQEEFYNIPQLLILIYKDPSLQVDFVAESEIAHMPAGDIVFDVREIILDAQR